MILANKKELIIRKATPEDAAPMVEYLNLIGGESDNLTYGKNEFRFTVKEEKQFLLHLSPGSALFLGLIEGKLVSIGNIMRETKPRLAHNATLGLSVRKEYWHQGIGKAMMTELIDYAKNSGIRNLRLEVRSDHRHAISLYQKMGFETVGLLRGELKVGDGYYDNLIMCLYLDGDH